MAAPRNENIKEVILEKTAELMEEKGIGSISLANIADACGISKGTLYYHYTTKEDIIFDITDRYLSQQEELLYLWTGDASKDTSLNRFLMYVLQRSYHEIGPRLQLYYAACYGNDALRQKLIDRYRRYQRIIAEEVLKRDDIPEDKAGYFAWLALLLSDGLSLQAELGDPDFNADRFIRETEEFFPALF